MLGLHGAVFLLALLWIWVRQRQWSWRDLLPARARDKASEARSAP
jgi:hypothetical protein